MESEIMEVFLYLVQATASKDNEKYHVGERHAALVFALAPDIQDGMQMAINHMNESCWESVDVVRSKLLNVESLSKMDAVIQESYETALKFGTSGIIYQDPIT